MIHPVFFIISEVIWVIVCPIGIQGARLCKYWSLAHTAFLAQYPVGIIGSTVCENNVGDFAPVFQLFFVDIGGKDCASQFLCNGIAGVLDTWGLVDNYLVLVWMLDVTVAAKRPQWYSTIGTLLAYYPRVWVPWQRGSTEPSDW